MNTTDTTRIENLIFTITVTSYDEHDDKFLCSVVGPFSDEPFDCTIPAFLMPVLAREEQDECGDLPYGFIGVSFDVAQLP